MRKLLKSFLIATAILFLTSCGPSGDSSASAQVWLDKNANGVKDAEDTPFEGVCIWADTSHASFDEGRQRSLCAEPDIYYDIHTDKMGNFPGAGATDGISFFAGARCSDITIIVIVPDGYKATTPSKVRNCSASFGLAKQ